ncbi:13551_t:CDS:2, partial [Gigaspora rosea]
CYVRILNNPIFAILDSEAAVSIISKRLLNKVRLKIDKELVTVVVMATGAKAKTLGKQI